MFGHSGLVSAVVDRAALYVHATSAEAVNPPPGAAVMVGRATRGENCGLARPISFPALRKATAARQFWNLCRCTRSGGRRRAWAAGAAGRAPRPRARRRPRTCRRYISAIRMMEPVIGELSSDPSWDL